MSPRPDKISDKIEPELRTPPPRKVRRRPPRALQSATLSGVSDVAVKLQPLLSAMLLIPALWSLYFFKQLIGVLSEVASTRGGPAAKPFVDAIPLIIINVVWNIVALPMTWKGFVKPLIHR